MTQGNIKTFPISEFEEWFIQQEATSYRLLLKRRRTTLLSILKGILDTYSWLKDAKIKLCDKSMWRKELGYFVDVKEYDELKRILHKSQNPRRIDGPWSNFEISNLANSTDLIRDNPLPWQKSVLDMMAMNPCGQIIVIQAGRSNGVMRPSGSQDMRPSGNKYPEIQGKRLFLEYIEEEGLAKVHHIFDQTQFIAELRKVKSQKMNNIVFFFHNDAFSMQLNQSLVSDHTLFLLFANNKLSSKLTNIDNVFQFAIQDQKLVTSYLDSSSLGFVDNYRLKTIDIP